MELVILFKWWLILEVLALINFPLSYFLFGKFPLKGWEFRRALSLLFPVALIWWLARMFNFPFNKSVILGTIGIIILSNGFLYFRFKKEYEKFFKENIISLLTKELIFALALFAFAFIKAKNSAIFAQEKYMDFAFLNSITYSNHLPPPDPWLAGYTINYYYMGYLIYAFLCKLGNIPTAIGYNLSLATTMALGVEIAWAIGRVVSNTFWGGALSAFTVCVMGNLAGITNLLKGINWNYWWDASRVIPNTINEFPMFSLLVGDLHPHFTSYPFFILALAVVYEILFTSEYRLCRMVLQALICGSLIFMNLWSFPIIVLMLACVAYRKRSFLPLIIFIFGLVFYFPFFLEVHSPQKLLVLPVPANLRTPFWAGFKVWGVLAVATLFYLWEDSGLANEGKKLLFPLITLAILVAGSTHNFWLPFWLLTFVFVIKKVVLDKKEEKFFFNLLILFSLLFLLLCELFYIQDNYGHPLERMNTVFKFHYQIWMLAGIWIASLFFLEKSRLIKGILGFLLLPGLVYPVVGTINWARNYSGTPTLDGLKVYMEPYHPADYKGILWLINHRNILPKEAVIWEDTGDPYSYYARVSTNTGISTVLGWANHEWVWRGNGKITEERKKDINTFFTSDNINQILELAKKYNAYLVFYGELEHKDFPGFRKENLEKIAHKLYQGEGCSIYQINKTTPVD